MIIDGNGPAFLWLVAIKNVMNSVWVVSHPPTIFLKIVRFSNRYFRSVFSTRRASKRQRTQSIGRRRKVQSVLINIIIIMKGCATMLAFMLAVALWAPSAESAIDVKPKYNLMGYDRDKINLQFMLDDVSDFNAYSNQWNLENLGVQDAATAEKLAFPSPVLSKEAHEVSKAPLPEVVNVPNFYYGPPYLVPYGLLWNFPRIVNNNNSEKPNYSAVY